MRFVERKRRGMEGEIEEREKKGKGSEGIIRSGVTLECLLGRFST